MSRTEQAIRDSIDKLLAPETDQDDGGPEQLDEAFEDHDESGGSRSDGSLRHEDDQIGTKDRGKVDALFDDENQDESGEPGEDQDDDDDLDEGPEDERRLPEESTNREDDDESLDANALAKKLDITVKELYSVKFKYGDQGESLTLGELKDVGARAGQLDDEAEMLVDDRTRLDNDNMKSRVEIQNIVSLLPIESLTPALIQQSKEQHESLVRQERIALHETIPGWKEPSVELTDRAAMNAHLAEYGFKEVEANYMIDHRLIKFIHDMTVMRDRSKLKAAEVRKIAKKNQRRRRPGVVPGSKGKHSRAKALGKGGDARGAINVLFED